MIQLTSQPSPALVGAKAAAAVLLFQACVGGAAMAQSANSSRAIEGIWDTTVTARDCASGAPLGPPFKALIVFRRGGTFDVDNTPGGAQARALRGNIYGIWKRGAGTTYTANAVHHRYNPDGSYGGNNLIQRSLTLAADANSFTSTLAVQILDLNGTVVSEVCPTEVGVRMNL